MKQIHHICSVLLLGISLIIVSVSSFSADFQKGSDDFNRANFRAALRALAEKGDADAQNVVGWMYLEGEGVPQSDREAVKWFRKSAEQGDAEAQNTFGCMYIEGRGVPQSDTEAVKWYHKSAEQGQAIGQSNLG